MSPKVADPAVRRTLVDVAARMIASDGPGGLTLRRLAEEAGTSTMAVYTHFGSMPELRREVRREGFSRLRSHLDGVAETDDPVADVAVLGLAYYRNGITNPNLYRAMFMEATDGNDGREAPIGLDTFEALVAGVKRCLDAGRFRPAELGGGDDARALAIQLWSLAHGVVTLQLAGMLEADEALAAFASAGCNLFVGFGDRHEAAAAATAAAGARLAEAG